ncbi:MAG: hypothetical protein JXR76_09200 [Deltaproteobacteria bacterium]|nr:hypothetical protein [Deltaproteobacteria bacterium]
MENLETIIEVIFVIIFLFGRFFLRLLTSGKTTAPKKSAHSAEPAAPTTPAPQPAPQVKPEKAPISRKLPWQIMNVSKLARKKTPTIKGMAAAVLAALEIQHERAKAIANTCSYRNFEVLQQLALRYGSQIKELISQLQDLQDDQKLTRNHVDTYNKAVAAADSRLNSFENVLNERTSANAAYFDAADRILADLVNSTARRHRGGQALYQNLFGGVVISESSVEGALFGVRVAEEDIAKPARWSVISFELHLAIARHGRFADRLSGDLGLPKALASMAYFRTSGRLVSTGLVSSWITWLYADVSATLQMGQAYAAALLQQIEKGGDLPTLTRFSVDGRGHIDTMPLISRLVVVHGVLHRMGVFDMKDFNNRTAKIIEQYPDIIINMPGKGDVPIPGATVNADLFQVAISMVDTPLSVLGGDTLKEVVGNDFGPGQLKQLAAMGTGLRRAKPQFNARPTRLVMAIYEGLKQERNAERRIESAALKSLQKHQPTKAPRSPRHIHLHGSPQTLEDVFSPACLPKTIMIGALSKNRGGISPRR